MPISKLAQLFQKQFTLPCQSFNSKNFKVNNFSKKIVFTSCATSDEPEGRTEEVEGADKEVEEYEQDNDLADSLHQHTLHPLAYTELYMRTHTNHDIYRTHWSN